MKLSFAIVVSAWLAFAVANEKLELGYKMDELHFFASIVLSSVFAFAIDSELYKK